MSSGLHCTLIYTNYFFLFIFRSLVLGRPWFPSPPTLSLRRNKLETNSKYLALNAHVLILGTLYIYGRMTHFKMIFFIIYMPTFKRLFSAKSTRIKCTLDDQFRKSHIGRFCFRSWQVPDFYTRTNTIWDISVSSIVSSHLFIIVGWLNDKNKH